MIPLRLHQHRTLVAWISSVLVLVVLAGQFLNCCRLNTGIRDAIASTWKVIAAEETAPGAHACCPKSAGQAAGIRADAHAKTPAGSESAQTAWTAPWVASTCGCAVLMAPKPVALVEIPLLQISFPVGLASLLPLASPSSWAPSLALAAQAAPGSSRPVYLQTLHLLV